MKKNISLLLFLIVLSSCFGTISCQKETNNFKEEHFQSGSSYLIDFTIAGYQTNGILSFDSDNNMHFLHDNPDSPLYGMEEYESNGTMYSNYMGIEWQSDEFITSTGQLNRIFHVLREKSAQAEEKDTYDGEEVIKRQYEFDGNTIILLISEKQKIPLLIQTQWNKIDYEISFLKLNPRNDKKLSA